MIRVFVVDDSPFVRKALRRVFQGTPDLRVIGEAATAAEALARIPESQADVVTLDVDLQGMSGLTVLRRLMATSPDLRVLMLSALTQQGTEATLDALSAGAADFVDKQQLNFMDLDALDRELVDRVRSIAGLCPPASALPPRATDLPDLSRTELIVIGASTGGPAAIQGILQPLPAGYPVPIAVVQHMPPGFTRAFAARLDSLCRVRVTEAVDGARLVPGSVFIAPAGQQLRFNHSLVASVSAEANGVRRTDASVRHAPSVNVLFESAARARRAGVLGVLLTGMGDDGAEGMAAIQAGGGITIAESEDSCAVYGMPRAAVLRGAARLVLPLGEIAEVVRGVRGER